MTVSGEVHCLACGRYLADAAGSAGAPLRLLPVGGRGRIGVRVDPRGQAFCRYCGGRAFLENEIVRQSTVRQPAPRATTRSAA